MNEIDIGALLHDCMVVTMKLCLPILGVALVVGLVISFIQAITQINEATLAFVPKVLALCAALVVLGPFMFATLAAYTHTLFDRLIAVGGS